MRPDMRITALYICLLGIELCGLYLILDLFNTVTVQNTLSVFGLLVLYPISFIVNKALNRLPWYRFFLFIINWIAWAIAFLLMIKFQLFPVMAFTDPAWLTAFPDAFSQCLVAFKPEILIFLSSILLWWTGRRMASLEINYSTVLTEFQFWLFLIIVMLLSASGFNRELQNAVFIVICFFFLSLTGISIAHALEGKSWLSGLPTGHWAAMLLISIAVVLIIGVVIALLFTPDMLRILISWVEWIIGIIWYLFVMLLQWLSSLLPPPDPGELPPLTPGPAMGPPPEENIGFQIPEAVRTILQILWSTLVGGLIIAALWSLAKQIFDRLQRRSNTQGARTQGMRGAFKEDLIALFRHLWNAISRLFFRRTSEKELQENPGTALTRRIYRDLLRWAARHKCSRDISQTPHEFCDMISALIPDARAELSFITNHYVNVRYGLSVPSNEDRERLQRNWLTIKKKRLRAHRAADPKENNYGKTTVDNG